MLCRGAEVKIRVHWRISVEAPESMQESKLFARGLQELDKRFVNTFIRKNEIFYMPFKCSPIWRIIRKLFLSTGCLCYNSSSDTIFLDGRFPLDADWGNLHFFVVKVYNINTKMYMYHVISWGKFIILQHALETVIMLLDRQIWCCHAGKCLDFPPFFVGRSSSDLGRHFTWHRYWKKKEGLQSYTSDK